MNLKDKKIIYNDNPFNFKQQLELGFTAAEAKQNLSDSKIILYSGKAVRIAVLELLRREREACVEGTGIGICDIIEVMGDFENEE